MDFALSHAKQIPDDRKLFGQAVDYPDSAIVAFEDHLAKGEDSLMDSNHYEFTEEEKAFTFFRLSKANWEKEIVWLEQIIAAVKEYSPEIYSQVMDSYYQRN